MDTKDEFIGVTVLDRASILLEKCKDKKKALLKKKLDENAWEYHGQKQIVLEALREQVKSLEINNNQDELAIIDKITAPVMHPIFKGAVQNPEPAPMIKYARKHNLIR